MTVRETATEFSNDTPPPAYFLSLSIENFRCFGPKQTLDLSDGNGHPAKWTVLLGENGVGKTTILQMIAMLAPILEIDSNEPSESYQPVNLYVPRFIFNGGSDYFPEELQFSGKKKVFRSSAALQLSSNDGSITGIDKELYNFGFNPIEDGRFLNFYHVEDWRFRLSPVPLMAYGALRKSSRSGLSDSMNDQPIANIFDDSFMLRNAEEWLLITDYASRIGDVVQQQRASNRLRKVSDILINILPDVQGFRFSTNNDAHMTPRVEAQTPYGWVRLADLSLGYRTALTWMVDLGSHLFEHYPDSPNPLAEPAICLVDEIDLHLHPRWQRELVQKLTETFPNTQFIVTAHSPLIVQAAPNANLALLRREGDHVVIDNDVDEIRNWRVDQILTSDLFGLETARPPQLAPALEERRRILSQPDLTDADKARVAKLDAEINEKTSVGENPLEMRALDALRRAAALLERDEAAQKTAR
jgi:energy-coupling factor transporter ATP-binding protein EcfA2